MLYKTQFCNVLATEPQNEFQTRAQHFSSTFLMSARGWKEEEGKNARQDENARQVESPLYPSRPLYYLTVFFIYSDHLSSSQYIIYAADDMSGLVPFAGVSQMLLYFV